MHSLKRLGTNVLTVIGGIILANIIVQLFNFFTGTKFAPNDCNLALLVGFFYYASIEMNALSLLILPDDEKLLEISKLIYTRSYKKISDVIEIMDPHQAAKLLYLLINDYNLSEVAVTNILSLCPKDLGKDIAQKIERLQTYQR